MGTGLGSRRERIRNAKRGNHPRERSRKVNTLSTLKPSSGGASGGLFAQVENATAGGIGGRQRGVTPRGPPADSGLDWGNVAARKTSASASASPAALVTAGGGGAHAAHVVRRHSLRARFGLARPGIGAVLRVVFRTSIPGLGLVVGQRRSERGQAARQAAAVKQGVGRFGSLWRKRFSLLVDLFPSSRNLGSSFT